MWCYAFYSLINLCFHLRLSFISWCHHQVSLILLSEKLCGRFTDGSPEYARKCARFSAYIFFFINPNVGSEKCIRTFLPRFRNVFVRSNLYKWGPWSPTRSGSHCLCGSTAPGLPHGTAKGRSHGEASHQAQLLQNAMVLQSLHSRDNKMSVL